MRKFLSVIIIVLLLSILGYVLKLNDDKNDVISERDYSIEILNKEIEDVKDELEKLENRKVEDFASDYQLSQINESIVDLCKEELRLAENRVLRREVFYGMIKDTDFEKYIDETTYRSDKTPLLNKVTVEIEGTSNIIDFYSKLYSDYHWLYMSTNYK